MRACFMLATCKGVPGSAKKGCAHRSERQEREREGQRKREREKERKGKMTAGLKRMTGA